MIVVRVKRKSHRTRLDSIKSSRLFLTLEKSVNGTYDKENTLSFVLLLKGDGYTCGAASCLTGILVAGVFEQNDTYRSSYVVGAPRPFGILSNGQCINYFFPLECLVVLCLSIQRKLLIMLATNRILR